QQEGEDRFYVNKRLSSFFSQKKSNCSFFGKQFIESRSGPRMTERVVRKAKEKYR
uniref:Uncharacterized protein n=1 Tax=Anopheles quadriannulatus TaxID=34691 RepID=A0A182XRG9_ANOQN